MYLRDAADVVEVVAANDDVLHAGTLTVGCYADEEAVESLADEGVVLQQSEGGLEKDAAGAVVEIFVIADDEACADVGKVGDSDCAVGCFVFQVDLQAGRRMGEGLKRRCDMEAKDVVQPADRVILDPAQEPSPPTVQ